GPGRRAWGHAPACSPDAGARSACTPDAGDGHTWSTPLRTSGTTAPRRPVRGGCTPCLPASGTACASPPCPGCVGPPSYHLQASRCMSFLPDRCFVWLPTQDPLGGTPSREGMGGDPARVAFRRHVKSGSGAWQDGEQVLHPVGGR